MVDLRPAIQCVVAETRFDDLVLRYVATCAVGTLLIVHFADPVVSHGRFGDINLQIFHMDFVERVDQEIGVVVDNGDAQRIETATERLELRVAVD